MLLLAFALPWMALASGCGQKGPLFHPPDPTEKKDGQEKAGTAPPAAGAYPA